MQIARSHTEENYLKQFYKGFCGYSLNHWPMNTKPNARHFHNTISFFICQNFNTISLALKACFKKHIKDILRNTMVSSFPQGCS